MLCVVWIFVFGLGIGSFLNVLIARLPFEKSVVWPGSRCFSCYRSLRLTDNLPLIGYWRLGGRCRHCGSTFSARYIWVEFLTGLSFVAIFVMNALTHWQNYPGIAPTGGDLGYWVPPLNAWLLTAAHCFLMAMLIASFVIDWKYLVIPPHITVVGTLVGIAISPFMPWPWPNLAAAHAVGLPTADQWAIPDTGRILNGLAMLPVWGPVPDWLPMGSWQHGLVSSLFGAFVGQLTGRAVRFLFGVGFRQEALGLGDADLLMMIGAFLGWQIALLAMPIGAITSLPIVLIVLVVSWLRKPKPPDANAEAASLWSGMPFGPGIILGTFVCWFGWPWVGEGFRIYLFDACMMTAALGMVGGGLLVFGFLLRR
jgi:leader peptidase (prepilin peptidase)/N-methyltransferase